MRLVGAKMAISVVHSFEGAFIGLLGAAIPSVPCILCLQYGLSIGQ